MIKTCRLEPTQQRVGPLELNGALNNAEKYLKGKLVGPEAFEIYKGEVYTSVQTGEIVKISPGGHVTFVAKIGQPCSEYYNFILIHHEPIFKKAL